MGSNRLVREKDALTGDDTHGILCEDFIYQSQTLDKRSWLIIPFSSSAKLRCSNYTGWK
jgi:hypothetical protein